MYLIQRILIMKKVYCKPTIQVQSIESENLMENPMSIPVYTNEDELIEDGSEILVNKHSVWEEQYENNN